MLGEMAERLRWLDDRCRRYERLHRTTLSHRRTSQRLGQIREWVRSPAPTLLAAVGNAREFKSGRELAAWLELVPRQHSSGGRNVLRGISKRGDRYLRTLLIHGARSALRVAERRRDQRSIWACRLKLRRGPNVAAVALANKNVRVMWAMLTRGEDYRNRPPPERRRKNPPRIAKVVCHADGNRSDRRFLNLTTSWAARSLSEK